MNAFVSRRRVVNNGNRFSFVRADQAGLRRPARKTAGRQQMGETASRYQTVIPLGRQQTGETASRYQTVIPLGRQQTGETASRYQTVISLFCRRQSTPAGPAQPAGS